MYFKGNFCPFRCNIMDWQFTHIKLQYLGLILNFLEFWNLLLTKNDALCIFINKKNNYSLSLLNIVHCRCKISVMQFVFAYKSMHVFVVVKALCRLHRAKIPPIGCQHGLQVAFFLPFKIYIYIF